MPTGTVTVLVGIFCVMIVAEILQKRVALSCFCLNNRIQYKVAKRMYSQLARNSQSCSKIDTDTQ